MPFGWLSASEMRRRRRPVSGVSHEGDCNGESGSGDAFRLRLLGNMPSRNDYFVAVQSE